MAYASGFRDARITVLARTEAQMGAFGIDTDAPEWAPAYRGWASVTWQRGLSAMRAGALDVYAVVLVRMNYSAAISPRCRIEYDEQTYQILPETFHADRRRNEIQFTAQAIVSDKAVNLPPYSGRIVTTPTKNEST